MITKCVNSVKKASKKALVPLAVFENNEEGIVGAGCEIINNVWQNTFPNYFLSSIFNSILFQRNPTNSILET
uniref:Uncharacterized protein n=1 Tax=Rhizophora mucronata TaxID=61149 RepID=A0A2P2PD37_RHIMU